MSESGNQSCHCCYVSVGIVGWAFHTRLGEYGFHRPAALGDLCKEGESTNPDPVCKGLERRAQT